MAPSTARPSAAASLPPEMLQLIFAPLSQPSVLTAAAVCSWWRACAVQHPMYYRCCAFVFPEMRMPYGNNRNEYPDVRKLVRVVCESEDNGYNLGLRLFVHLDQLSPSGGGSSPEADIAAPWAVDIARVRRLGPIIEAMLVPVLQRVLARCVALNVSCDSASAALIWRGLSFRAPILTRLNISIERDDPDNLLRACEPIPAPFLSADAPRLTHVSLFRVGATAPSPCFSSVHTLLLDRPLDLSAAHAAFPGTKHLTIRYLPRDYEHSHGDNALFTDLESLSIGPMIMHILAPAPALKENVIPLIEYRGISPDDVGELVPASGEISVHIFERVRPNRTRCSTDAAPRIGHLCVEFMAGGLICRVDSDVPFTESCGFVGLSRALPYITELTIDDRHVRTLLQTWGRFPSLRILRITVVTWARPAPGVLLTPDEELVYLTGHIRSRCACLGGVFADRHDGSCPDGDVHMELVSLQTLELRAARLHAFVPAHTLRALSRSFGRHLHLVLSNGLSLVPDNIADPQFASVSSADASFCAALPHVARAAALFSAAASQRKDALREMDRALRQYGLGFHWDHCAEPRSISKANSRMECT